MKQTEKKPEKDILMEIHPINKVLEVIFKYKNSKFSGTFQSQSERNWR